MSAVSRDNARHVGLGVLLIGLGWMFLTGYWWPGILFVLGFMMIAQAIAENRRASDMRSGVLLIGLGVIFAVGLKLWLLLILAGLALLFASAVRRPMSA